MKAQVWDALLYRHWDQYTGEKRSHILVVDTNGKNVRDVTPAARWAMPRRRRGFWARRCSTAWAPDSKEIAYVTNLDPVPAASTNNDVFTLRLDEPGAKAVKVSTSLGSDDAPAYSPDGRWLAFRSQALAGFESDRFRLMLYDREKKTIREVMPKFDGWVDEFVWATDSQFLYFASSNNGHEPILTASEDVPDLLSYVTSDIGWGGPAGLGETTLVPGGGIYQRQPIGEYGELNLSRDGETLVAVLGSANRPGEVINAPGGGGSTRVIKRRGLQTRA